ncbi:hypothetical protein [Salinivibrio proteolyticus]|uniref:Uncharacterized protein n=1 Tax=Salinivibrio proteolyticus TaxID=334715 RepID=A0ABY7L9A7_9GAMM|nr:hypothetical protein [Salinivibrio proteolyticus]WBA13833.1 hypothetical protein N7E60_08820 [Salinivibrio proteolyticus]
MKKIIKRVALFTIALLVSTVFLFVLFAKVSPVEGTSEGQMVGDILWYTAPDGGVGFKLLQENHPHYRIKIMMNSPDILYYEGVFEYQGTKLDHVELSDLGGYFGENIHLTNGEEMTPVTD